MIEFASGQITGRRAAQEDALDMLRLDGVPPALGSEKVNGAASTPLAPGLVMVVADGMGGHVGGRVASTICARTFLESVRTSEADWAQRLEEGLTSANDALRVEAENHPDLNGMGSTLIGAVVGEAGLGWISIGDSALYHFRAGTLTRLNEDHSFGAYLDQQAREGLMTSEAAATDRRRNHLFYALLGDHLDHYERFSGFRELAEDDLVLLASDGLKTLSDETIAEIAGKFTRQPDDLVSELLAAVEREDRERQDNVSVIAARISPARTAVRPALGTIAREAPTAGSPPTQPAPAKPPAPPASALPITAPTPPKIAATRRSQPIRGQHRLLIAGITIAIVAAIVALVIGFVPFR